jgi:hypothetical protein
VQNLSSSAVIARAQNLSSSVVIAGELVFRVAVWCITFPSMEFSKVVLGKEEEEERFGDMSVFWELFLFNF